MINISNTQLLNKPANLQLPVDFVILWVDGSDSEWLKERYDYLPDKSIISASDSRFRDWGTLRYWFRGVEAFAPWVRMIHFVTWGHLPDWLNTAHPKLNIVKHDDFIPHEYLPTFNSNVIELNLHRIDELSEHFVLFNDDMFLLKNTSQDSFFKNGLPRDEMIERAIQPDDWMLIHHTSVNNVGIINRHFDKRSVQRKIPAKVFSPLNGLRTIYTLSSLPYKRFIGFRNPHIPLSHLKSTFEEVWREEPKVLNDTCNSKFRTKDDVSHWLMRYWNLCSGRFTPRSPSFGRCYTLPKEVDSACSFIRTQNGNVICVNDSVHVVDTSAIEEKINSSFSSILPYESSFEC